MSIETKEQSITQQLTDANKAEADAPIAPPTDYQRLYEEKVAENDRLNAVIAAARIATSAPANKSHKPAITSERLRAMVGELSFHKMSRTEKLTALGVDPATPDDVLRRGWGRGNDGQFGQDLHKTDPRLYSLLREAAFALNIFGN